MRHDTWILIANGARARLVAGERNHGVLLVEEIDSFAADHRPNRELERDRPARVFESHGETRHAIEPKHDPHRMLKREFASAIAGVLDQALEKKRFERLVIVAPPVTLGDLREVLTPAVRARVFAELPNDLTKVPNDALSEHIYDRMPL